MGNKRRNAKDKTYTGRDANTTNTNSYGGGSRNNDKYAVFDFADDELRVETESRKTLAKFGTKSPGKKPACDRKAVDKYVFLECFAQGAVARQKDSGNDMSDVDATDRVLHDITFGTAVTVSPSSLNCEAFPLSFPKNQGLNYASGIRKPGGYTTSQKHNKASGVDFVKDGRKELTLSSSFDLAENEGFLEEQPSVYEANDNDCETVVVVAPYYVKYGNTCHKSCILTFSRSCIRLEESPLRDKSSPFRHEWSTFDILKIEYQQCESVVADMLNLHLKSKDRNVDETGNSSSGSVELEFIVLADPQWSKKKEEIKSLDLIYKAAWKTIVSECCFSESFESLIYPDDDPDAVFLSRSDIELLQPKTFINDTIIDFYIKYLVKKIKPREQHRFHFFNTFFFQKLVNMDRDVNRDCEGKDAFRHVRKWTRNVNLFEKDYIFIPVNFSLHWSLIVICHPGEVANLQDESMDGSSRVPCILHMDSIRGSHGGFEDLIRSYLLEEWKGQGNMQEDDITTKFLNLDFIMLQLPQQENFSDCGLFLLHYAELFLEQESNFRATKYIDFLNKDWFFPAEVSLKKRDHIRKVIHRIVEDNALKDPPATSNKCYQSGASDGDSGAKIVQQNGAEELCPCIKFDCCDDFDNEEQQSFTAMSEHSRNNDKSVICESSQPCKLVMPINQFNNMSMPMEEALEKQATFPPGKTTFGNRYNFRGLRRRMKGSQETSKTCCDESLIIIDEQNEESCVPEVTSPTERQQNRNDSSPMSIEDIAACAVEDSDEESCVPEVASPTERQKNRNDNCPMSIEDIEACVVEDSEEESDTESIEKTSRRSSSMIR